MPNGVSLMSCEVRLLLEMRPEFMMVKIDLRNAYNEVKRAAVLRSLQASPQARGLAPLFHATHSHPAQIFPFDCGHAES